MTAAAIANLIAYGTQLAVLVLVALAAARLWPSGESTWHHRFWQAVFAVAVALPLLTLWPPAAASVMPAFIADADMAITLAAGRPGTDGWPRIALGLVAAGTAARLAWLLLGTAMLRRYVARATPIAAAHAGGLDSALDVRISHDVHGPVTIGALAPVILLPPAWCDLDPGAARAVLEHEAAHVRRRDWLRLWLEELWCACLWFHPLARTLATRLDLTREMVVDREVMARTGDRAAYARALLAFADAPPSPPPVAPLIRHRHLDTRIAALTQEVPMATPVVRRLALVAAVLTLTCTAAAARVVPMPGVQGAVPDRQLPVVIHEVKPDYTPEALAAKIAGVVVLSAVVERDGTVGAVRVTQSLDTELGLDAAAVSAMRGWRFEPALKGGIPVPVEIAVEMRFTLKD